MLPEAAYLASLGCGNPTAVADLLPGEMVLDLGSGGGIDVLLDRHGLHEPKVHGVRHHRRHAVVPQPTRMDRGRHEVLAERVHLQQRGQAREVRAAARARKPDVGLRLARRGELDEHLLADEGLVQQHVVEHAAQRVVSARVLRGDLDGLTDRHAVRAGRVGQLREDRPTRVSVIKRVMPSIAL